MPRSKQKPIRPPASSGPLRPFTVRQTRRTRLILWLLFAMLLLGGVVLLVVGVAQGIRNDNGFLVVAFFCGLSLPVVGIVLYAGARNRLVVDPGGLHLIQGRKTRSIPWDQLDDVTVEAAQGENGEQSSFFVQLVFVTPTGKVRSTGGRRGAHGRVWQLAETILYYHERIRAGAAKWEPTIDDDAMAHPRHRRVSDSAGPDRSKWRQRLDDAPAWLRLSLSLLTVLFGLAIIALGVVIDRHG